MSTHWQPGSIDLPASGVTAGTYGDGTHVGQVTVAASGLVTAASNVLITGGGGGSFTTGSSPPGAPTDGDYWIFPADSTNGVYWLFQYVSTQATYKWVCVGPQPFWVSGSQNAVINAMTQVGATSSWYDPATMSYTVARAGDYIVSGNVKVDSNGGASTWFVGQAFHGSALGNAEFQAVWNTAVQTLASVHVFDKIVSVAAGTIIGICVNSGNNGTYKCSSTGMEIIPVRVI